MVACDEEVRQRVSAWQEIMEVRRGMSVLRDEAATERERRVPAESPVVDLQAQVRRVRVASEAASKLRLTDSEAQD